MAPPFRVPLVAPEATAGAVLRAGVPLPRGRVADVHDLAVVDETGAVPAQCHVLERWSDRSVRWVQVDFVLPAAPSGAGPVAWLTDAADARMSSTAPAWVVEQADGGIALRAGAACARLRPGASGLLSAEGLPFATIALLLRTTGGQRLTGMVRAVELSPDAGPVRADVVVDGDFGTAADCPLQFRARCIFSAADEIAIDLRIRNPRPAQHAGGLWDLGDPGSVAIADLSLVVTPAGPASATITWQAEPGAPLQRTDVRWTLYQDSSGGEHWNSPNHVDADGRSGVSFRGYRVSKEAATVGEGLRAQPWVRAGAPGAAFAVAIDEFWQNFPKALRWTGEAIEAALFPAERRAPVELQGGEQKRHVLRLALGTEETVTPRVGLSAFAEPAWVASTGAVPQFAHDLSALPSLVELLAGIVDGPRRFEARREDIDEYGWRNFGDLVADHEAVAAAGAGTFVSHYNNQYDFVLGAALQTLRTGDSRWARLMQTAARHTVDIDVYHTSGDKAAFNGGLFWHTDHHVPAATSTHRTYSRANAKGGDYGGGPSNEHNYASGLLLHHLLTGDADSRDTVIGLADWVLAMDDGEQTLFALVDGGPTGLASKTVEDGYHGPGRGAGNSINTLLDAYRLTRRRRYLAYAEALIARCIHPRDDIAARRLDDPEHRWSYLVFLQVLGRYLEHKHEMGEFDYAFHYARDSLLHYAAWMRDNEVPYRDVLHKVEFPTETWPAHDIRKCHVFHLAASWAAPGHAAAYRARAAFFFDRCLADLRSFATHDLTRPLVILCVYGPLHAWHAAQPLDALPGAALGAHAHDFGQPVPFVPQRARVRGALRAKLAVTLREARRLVADRLARRRAARASQGAGR